MQWAVFATLYENVAPPLTASVNAMIVALTAWVAPVLRDGILLFLVLTLLRGTIKRNMEPLSEVQEQAILGMAALYIATTAVGYSQYFSSWLLNGLSTEIGGALAGAVGNRPLTGALFDEIWNKAWVAGLAVFRNLPWSMAGFGLVGLVILYWIVAIFAIGVAFVVWLKAFIFISLLVGVGPLFAGLWLFPLTRGWFYGWLNTTMASVVLQILAVALLSLVLGAITRVLLVLSAASLTGGAANEIAQVQTLLGCMVLYAGTGWLALQLPGVAASITHGFTGFGHFANGLAGGRGGSAPAGAPAAAPPPASTSAPTRSVAMGAPGSGVIPAPPPIPATFRPMPPGPALSGRA